MTTEPTEEAPLELTVPFLGRELAVRLPTAEQLHVWQRVVTRLQEAPIDTSWTGTEVMAALERLRKIFDTVLTSRRDIDWLDDKFLTREADFQSLSTLLTQVIDTFAERQAETGNREERRAAGKKARRKKAAAA